MLNSELDSCVVDFEGIFCKFRISLEDLLVVELADTTGVGTLLFASCDEFELEDFVDPLDCVVSNFSSAFSPLGEGFGVVFFTARGAIFEVWIRGGRVETDKDGGSDPTVETESVFTKTCEES